MIRWIQLDVVVGEHVLSASLRSGRGQAEKTSMVVCQQIPAGAHQATVTKLSYFHESLEVQRSSHDAKKATLAQTWNQIGNLHLQRGEVEQMMNAFTESLRILRATGKSESDLAISGYNFYGLSKLCPECAPIA